MNTLVVAVTIPFAVLVSSVCIVITGCGQSSAPPAPLKVGFRGSALDRAGLVLQVQNTSDKHLSCRMTAVNSVQAQRVNYSFDLAPYNSTEIGVLECGWSFKTGEGVAIQVEGHSPVSFPVP